ncbi:MAG: hypothetical protein ACK5MD_10585 [Flavobacteriales bacterium]
MKTYTIYKGLQKPIRYIGLDKQFALLFIGYLVVSSGGILVAFSLSGVVACILFANVFVSYGYFKYQDKQNLKMNFKKKRAMKFKPDSYKRKNNPLTLYHGKLFD